jgi:hypothetical protein
MIIAAPVCVLQTQCQCQCQSVSVVGGRKKSVWLAGKLYGPGNKLYLNLNFVVIFSLNGKLWIHYSDSILVDIVPDIFSA